MRQLFERRRVGMIERRRDTIIVNKSNTSRHKRAMEHFYMTSNEAIAAMRIVRRKLHA